MKKIIFICLAFLISFTVSTVFAEFEDRGANYYTELDNNGIMFLLKFQSCAPAVNEATGEIIYGRQKNGYCHFSYNDKLNNRDVVYDCTIPMKTAIGYATTAYDVYDYSKSNPEISNERLAQNNEIRRVMQDYCKIKMK